MSNILHITASMRGEESISRKLSTALTQGLAQKTNASITERDLSANDLPYVDAARFAANLTPTADRTEEQNRLAEIGDDLIAELQAADTIVLGVPIYNFGVPAIVKAWADLVARAGTTFQYTANGPEGLLTGKKAYIALASGGTPAEGPMDFMTPWLKFFLGFLGIRDVEVIAADATASSGGEEKITAAQAKVENIIAA